jgi:hypothetical protein
MSNDIFFEEGVSGNNGVKNIQGQNNSGLMKIILNTGLVKNEKQALILFIIIIISMFFISLYLFFGRNNNEIKNVTTKDGRVYSFEEYERLSKEGKDPLLNDTQ